MFAKVNQSINNPSAIHTASVTNGTNKAATTCTVQSCKAAQSPSGCSIM
jgi:hypothetical protein